MRKLDAGVKVSVGHPLQNPQVHFIIGYKFESDFRRYNLLALPCLGETLVIIREGKGSRGRQREKITDGLAT
ncbi:hypothetical protein PoB_006680900 [Plakobranchus ocellatus]|uniref:Uncharacterized protein n=1 Tax=Plakobranchus ocellatus TaxID=259542 RepID=A0AAV4D814_9GAST|nr:hypothetical protein PoB_006680900 [Plakobranchus ocellatus]